MAECQQRNESQLKDLTDSHSRLSATQLEESKAAEAALARALDDLKAKHTSSLKAQADELAKKDKRYSADLQKQQESFT